ncbi:MAG: prepilin peptidase [Mariniblastus sp.]
MIASVCLLALMATAAATDIRDQKIYNWTTYSGIVLALALNAAASWLGRTEIADTGIIQSLVGFGACALIMLICFVLFQIGGGDVKLLAMSGAFLGPELGIEALLWTFVLGGAVALIILIWKLGAIRLLNRAIQQLMIKMNFGNWDPVTEEESKQLNAPLYLAPSALVGVLIVKFSVVDHLQTMLG